MAIERELRNLDQIYHRWMETNFCWIMSLIIVHSVVSLTNNLMHLFSLSNSLLVMLRLIDRLVRM